jgi:hypothetical protein
MAIDTSTISLQTRAARATAVVVAVAFSVFLGL